MANKSAFRSWWRKATVPEREHMAKAADTTYDYLYRQLSPTTRHKISVNMAVAIEKESRRLFVENGGITPIVTCADLAAMNKEDAK